MREITRDDERKLFEAYKVLDKICNKYKLKEDKSKDKKLYIYFKLIRGTEKQKTKLRCVYLMESEFNKFVEYMIWSYGGCNIIDIRKEKIEEIAFIEFLND